jgi:integrase
VTSRNKAGSMRERSDGKWQLRVYAGRDPVSGKDKYVTRTFHGGPRAAPRALSALVTEVQRGRFDRTAATVGQLLDKWVAHVEAVGRARPKTAYEYRRKIDGRIRPLLGDIRLDRLAPDTIDAAYGRWLEEGLSPASVHALHAILSAALRQAVRWGWIERTPIDRVIPPSARGREMKVPTPKQLSTLVGTVEKDDPVLATAIALAALTGCRRSELVALRWSDVDLTKGILRVSRGHTVVDGKTIVGDTKTSRTRIVALDDVCVSALRARWDYMVDLSERAESPLVKDPYILSYNANGARPVGPDTLTHRFGALCRARGWPYRFHDLRHFGATQLIAAGVDIRTVAGRLGHAQTSTTLNIYAHSLPERDREAAAVLGRALMGPA